VVNTDCWLPNTSDQIVTAAGSLWPGRCGFKDERSVLTARRGSHFAFSALMMFALGVDVAGVNGSGAGSAVTGLMVTERTATCRW
jgi:hypothetical protein